jgi:N-acetylmuramoyl-L-alanine amidase
MTTLRGFRYILCLLPFLCATLLVSSPASGQAPPPRLVVLGQELRTSPPPVLRDGTVFAPVDQAFAPYRAEVWWDPARRVAEITGARGERIVLRTNDPFATVGTDLRRLPAPPFLLGERLFVPVEFVYRALGAWVAWEVDEGTLHVAAQVLRLVFDRTPEGVRMQVEATGPVEARTARLQDPERLVIDLLHAASRIETKEAEIGIGGVRRVRVAQFQVKPYITRVVLDLDAPLGTEVQRGPGFDLWIALRPESPPASAGVSASAPEPTPAPSAEPVAPPESDVGPTPLPLPEATPEVRRSSGGTPPSPEPATPRVLGVFAVRDAQEFRILVEGSTSLSFREFTLRDPPRLVLDIPGVFVPVKQEFRVGGPVEIVRAAQHQPDVTRIVVQWRTPVPYRITVEDGGRRIVIAVAEAQLPRPPRGAHVVAIDPGHGGTDPGAIGIGGLVEKDVVLDVALRLRTFLLAQGVRVVLTREGDTTVDLSNRVPIAVRSGATVFVSVHANANTRGVIRGSETYYLKPDGLPLATSIQDELSRHLGIPDRGVRQANFKVLRDSPVPAALVEIGYLTNPLDASLLRTAAFRLRASEAIGRGILRFLRTAPPLP